MRAFGTICGGVVSLVIAGTVFAQEWTPAKNVDIVVASGAGGSSDRSARVVQKLLQANPAFPSVSVTNRPGGGGSVAFTFLTQHPGDPHYIATFSPTMLTNHILGVSKLNYPDFTPLSILLREYVVISVRADSPIASLKDLTARLKKDPQSVSFAFASARGNHNHVVMSMYLKSIGVDPKVAKAVIYSGGGEAVTAFLGGHIDVYVTSPRSMVPLQKEGRARILGVSSAQREPGELSILPTLKEQGIDAVFFTWRGFMGPRGLKPAEVAYWDAVFDKLAQSDEWKKDTESQFWNADYLLSAETRKHLDRENEVMKGILTDLGLAK